MMVQHLYHNKFLTTINFIEEILPYCDIVPAATIGEHLSALSSTCSVLVPDVTHAIRLRPLKSHFHLQPMLPGWFMEYTRGGEKAKREGAHSSTMNHT